MPRLSPVTALAALSVFGLAACGGGSPATAPESEAAAPAVEAAAPEETAEAAPTDAGPSIAEVIALRQGRLEDLGGAFRTINQQLRGDADMAVIQAAIASIPGLTEGIETWFPAGSGPESGIETEALATIWERPDDFAQKVADFKDASAALVLAGESGDLETIQAAVRATGATCGGCHDVYRKDD